MSQTADSVSKAGETGGSYLPGEGRRQNGASRMGKSEASSSRCGVIAALCLAILALAPAHSLLRRLCLTCHGDASMTDAAGHSIAVDGQKFGASIHGSLQCSNCHADIKGYPHPDKIAPVDCKTCHADQANQLKGSVHADSKDHPCTSCHGNAHEIYPKTDARSAVYPLNVPKTCGQCHSNDGMAGKHGLASVYPNYIDSIHGFALSKEGLLVAANCQSCHGSHGILSHTNPRSPTYKANIPQTCGNCHAKINDDYQHGVHGKAIAAGKMAAPVCTDCHTAHAILQPTEAAFRMQSTPICGNCHKDKFSTYRDTFHSQLGSLGGYVETARCWDCHQRARRVAGQRSQLAHQQSQSGQDLRTLPCGCEPELRPVSAACQRARPQAESGALLRAAVHESAARERSHVLHDPYHLVAGARAL